MFSHNFQTLCSVVSRIGSKSVFKMRPPNRPFNDIKYEDIPDVSPASIKKVLKTHAVSFEEGYTNYIIGCPVCKKAPKTAPKAYINKTTGMFMCMGCKYSGQWDSLETCITNKRSRAKSKTDSVNIISKAEDEYQKSNHAIKDVCDNTSKLETFTPEEVEKIFKKFKLPIVSQSVLELIDIRIDKDRKNLYFPLENAESEIVGYKVINVNVDHAKTLPSLHCGGLLTGKQPKGKDLAILVPNISDFLVLLKSKVSCSVVCLPNSVNSLPTVVLPSLERYKKLVLWLGDDVKSWDSARHFAKKLGEKRCYFIRPSEKQPLPHLDENQDFKSLINGAHTIWHKSITTFASLREDVLLELQNIDKVQGVKWKRYPALSKILKGHRRGELTIITGPTGSGKTTFISEYSLDLAIQGVNTLWGSFEIRNQRLARTMLQQLAGIPLDENLNLFDKWADEFEKLPIYFMTFHGQQPIKVVMEAVDHATYVYDIAHVIIDNVQFMMGLSEEQKHMDRFWKQDLIIAAFRDFATRKNCHVSLVIHPRKERDEEDLSTSSIFGSAKASQEADNVLIIQDKRLTSIKGKKYLQVAKNRYSGDLGIMTLDFDKSGLSFATKKKVVKTQVIRQEMEQPKEEQTPV